MDAAVQEFIESLQGSRHEVDGKTIRVFFDGNIERAKTSFKGIDGKKVEFSIDGCWLMNFPHEYNDFEEVNIQFVLQ